VEYHLAGFLLISRKTSMGILRSFVYVIAAISVCSNAPAIAVAQTNVRAKATQRTSLPKFITSQKTTVEPSSQRRGASGKLIVTLVVEDTFHIYDPNPGDPFLTATKVTPLKVPGVAFGKPVWPAPVTIKDAKVHEGTVTISIPFQVKSSAKLGKTTFGATFYAQGCNASTCYPPASFTVSVPVSIKQ
jgi:DsbC/DsbD-like thiol-disulfide interchange protein